MVRFVILAVLITVAVILFRNLIKMFYDPGRCPRCKGQGYWRGTRPDEKERCDLCGGSGRISQF